MQAPPWQYGEIRQTGIDFEDTDEVENYNQNQRAEPAREQALLARLGLGAADTVVDLGCGTGSFALEAAGHCGQVFAVDVSKAMLAHVRAAADAAGLGALQCAHAGFLTFEAPAGGVDAVVSRYALHHLPDFWKQAALVKVAGMLKPGGLFYLEDVIFSFPARDYVSGIGNWIERVARAPGEGFTEADFETHVREEFSTFAWIIEGLLKDAGFEIAEADTGDPAYANYLCRLTGAP